MENIEPITINMPGIKLGESVKDIVDIALFFVDTAQRKKEVKRKKWRCYLTKIMIKIINLIKL